LFEVEAPAPRRVGEVAMRVALAEQGERSAFGEVALTAVVGE
jgi:hypothetical protein